jgi:hypothetical protein
VSRSALILLLAACGTAREAPPPLPEAPGLDGLRAHLLAARADPARAIAGWATPPGKWRALVTPAYVEHRDDELAALAARGLAQELAAYDGAAPRAHYADDPALDAGQIHLRWMLPTLAPAAVVPGLDAVFVHDGDAWRALVDLDDTITAALPPDCAAAYRALAPKPCQEWAFEIAEGVLRGDDARTRRACAQATSLGCR